MDSEHPENGVDAMPDSYDKRRGSAQVSNPDRCQLSYPLTTHVSSTSPFQCFQTPTSCVSPITFPSALSQ